jgi:hypothetical protein
MLMQPGLDGTDIGEVSQNAGAEADIVSSMYYAHVHSRSKQAIPGIAKTV